MDVRCPQCDKVIKYSTVNEYRPFCSERCRMLDLGDWMTEKNRIPAEESRESAVTIPDSDIKH